MPILTADDLVAAARARPQIKKTAAFTTVAATPFSALDVAGTPGAGTLTIGNTTSGLVPTKATAGFPVFSDFGAGAVGYLAEARFKSSIAGGGELYDRLWHAGSFSLATAQTFTLTSQPSFLGRLPGGNDYTGLEIFLEVNQAVAASAVTVAVGYTNEAGVTGRSTGASGALTSFTTRRLVRLPLQAGDKGPQRIDSVTVGGTVAATGTVNVVVGRLLSDHDIRVANSMDRQPFDGTSGPIVFQDSAFWPVVEPDGTSSGVFKLGMTIVNG